MVSMKFVNSLSELASPVLTAYLNTQPSDASKQHAGDGIVGVAEEAGQREAAATVHEKEQKRFWRQVERVEEFLLGRKPQEKAVVIVAGIGTWKVVPLHVAVENELHWGQPAVTQLLWLLDEKRPHCIVAVDHKAARFFRYWGGEMEKVAERKFAIDVSEWRSADGAGSGTRYQESPRQAARYLR